MTQRNLGIQFLETLCVKVKGIDFLASTAHKPALAVLRSLNIILDQKCS